MPAVIRGSLDNAPVRIVVERKITAICCINASNLPIVGGGCVRSVLEGVEVAAIIGPGQKIGTFTGNSVCWIDQWKGENLEHSNASVGPCKIIKRVRPGLLPEQPGIKHVGRGTNAGN